MLPSVSVVIVNYNGESLLSDCIESVLSQTVSPAEVLVLDNNSSDQSLSILAGFTDPRLQVLPLSENAGYARACNIGIEKTRGELVAVLNNDVILDPKWLEALLQNNSPEWDFWASRIEFASPAGRIDSAGDGMAVVGTAFKHGHGDPADKHLVSREVFGPCAAAALYRRTLLESLGGFDPDYFLVYEDSDLNFRARLQGSRCLYVPSARVVHRVNTSIGTFSDTYVFFGHRNSEICFWKNMPLPLLLLYLPERAVFNTLAFLFFLWKGRSGAFLRGKMAALRMGKSIVLKRKLVQSRRQLSARQLRRLLDRNWLKYRRKGIGRA